MYTLNYGLNVAICISVIVIDYYKHTAIVMECISIQYNYLKLDHNMIYKWYHRLYIFSLGYACSFEFTQKWTTPKGGS